MTNTSTITRRDMLAAMLRTIATSSIVSAIVPNAVRAQTSTIALTVYKDASCRCCTKWVAHMRENGFAATVVDRADMSALKDSMGVPEPLRSCHTAVAGKYLIEGHVPAIDVKRLFATAPKGVVGLAAPGMPNGSPGMEGSRMADQYSVIAFSANGATNVFARHG